MSRPTRYSNRDGEGDEPRSRRAPARKGLPIGPIVILLLLLGGALFFARVIAQSGKDKDDKPVVADTGYVPFGDLPDETAMPPGSHKAGGSAPRKDYEAPPPGLLATNQVWLDALKDATEAEILFVEAHEAKLVGGHAEFRDKGIRSKKLFSKLLDSTNALEEEMLETYGDRDPQTREVVRKRSKWIKRLSAISKTTGR